jgi:Arc/MetJ family transcription regulator
MRMTVDLDDELVARAMRATQAPTRAAVIEMGLRELLANFAREGLAAFHGSDPGAKAPARRQHPSFDNPRSR